MQTDGYKISMNIGILPSGIEDKIMRGAPSPAVIDIATTTFAAIPAKPSARLWVAMLRAGKWDRRRLKRVFRLVHEGR